MGEYVEIIDAAGQVLLLNVNRATVEAPVGEGGVLPIEYSFGCDSTVFIGTLPE